MDVYAENILEHYRNPRGKQGLASPTVEHEEINLSCGDTLKLQLQIENGTLKSFGWDGTGCAISQAAMSLLAEDLEGKSMEELEALQKEDIYELLGVPVGPRRVKCALLCLHTLKNALRKAQSKQPQGWLDTVELKED